MRSQKAAPAFLEDLVSLAAGAAGAWPDVGQKAKKLLEQKIDSALEKMDLVRRADFDRVEAMVRRARERQEELEEKLDKILTHEKRQKTKHKRGKRT